MLVHQDPGGVRVDRARVADAVPRQVEPGQGVQHQVLCGVDVAGEEVRRALQAALPCGEPDGELRLSGRTWRG